MNVFIGDAACCLAAQVSDVLLPRSEGMKEGHAVVPWRSFHVYGEKARVACVEVWDLWA